MRLRNDTGYPLEIRIYGRTVWPGEEITTEDLGHDMDAQGVITGLTVVDDGPGPKTKPATKDTAATGKEQTK